MTKQPKILILDDQMLAAFEVAAVLEENGFEVVGPFASVKSALSTIASETPDAAILDINMGDGTTSVPLADMLMEQNLPFAVLSGYGSAGLMPNRFAHVDQVSKPIRPAALVSLVARLTEGRA